MNLDFKIIAPGQISQVVGNLSKYLKKSEPWTKGRANVDDIMRFVYIGQMNLWVIYDIDTMTVYGYVISEIKNYPQNKWLVLQYMAGESHIMKLIDDKMHIVLEQFAKDAGCVGCEYIGRLGWRALAKKHGFAVQTVMYEKIFGEVI